MRKSELPTLRWPNIDFANKLITIDATNSKNKKKKLIPISESLNSILLKQKLKTGFDEFVFHTPDGKPYNRQDSLKKSFIGACRRAGITGLRFHDLRHTAATRMMESGANIVAVSKILGHSDLKTTMRYAHPDESLRETVEKVGNFNKKYSNEKADLS